MALPQESLRSRAALLAIARRYQAAWKRQAAWNAERAEGAREWRDTMRCRIVWLRGADEVWIEVSCLLGNPRGQ